MFLYINCHVTILSIQKANTHLKLIKIEKKLHGSMQRLYEGKARRSEKQSLRVLDKRSYVCLKSQLVLKLEMRT